MSWADRKAVVHMKMDTKSAAAILMRERSAELDDEQFSLYTDAANYYLELGDAQLAVAYAEKSVELQKKFWNTHTLAKAYKLNGQNEKALKTANESLVLSQKAEYQAYIEMNEKLISELKK
jgi:tetratricopeptide (TPR) repeat protein